MTIFNETNNETKIMINSFKTHIKDCLIYYNDKNQPEELNLNPKCCLSFKTSAGENQYICSSSNNCEYEAMLMIKKIKLTCDGMPLENVKEKLGFNSLIM